MDERRRWDTDERLTGVAGADTGDLERLVRAAGDPGWVAEDADGHLGVPLRRACAAAGSSWRWLRAAQGADGVYVVHLAHPSARGIVVWREAVALLTTVAESSFYVRRVADRTFDCVTGMLPGDGSFAAHGHTVRLVVEPAGD